MLTKYNGETITYDVIGNPLTYRDGITMTWQNGRELASFKQGNVDVSYTYDPSGLRTRKTVVEDTVTTDYKYVYEDGLLMQMSYGNHIFNFSYDANGTPISLNHIIPNSGLNEYYYYGVNSRGDVEALYYGDGSLYVTYNYDSYGNLLGITSASGADFTNTDTIATKNPLRYRSYVYDFETGLYYLQSRYYDPTTCRFINADVLYETGQGITGYNMFAYCNNNPVMCSDPTGECATHTYYYMPSCPGCNPELAALHAERGADWAEYGVYKKPAEPTFIEKCDQFVRVVYNSAYIEAGVGMGFGGSANVLEQVSVDAGFSYNPIHVSWSSDGFKYEPTASGSFGCSFLGVPIKFADYSSKLNVKTNEWTDDYTSDFYIFDIGGYFMYGFSLTAGFDMDKITEGYNSIWK